MSDKLPGISGAHFGDHHAAPFIGGPGGSPVQFGMTMIRAALESLEKEAAVSNFLQKSRDRSWGNEGRKGGMGVVDWTLRAGFVR
jgi:hypothetical protein